MDDGHSGTFFSKWGADWTKLTDFGLNTAISVVAGVYIAEGVADVTYGPFGVLGSACADEGRGGSELASPSR